MKASSIPRVEDPSEEVFRRDFLEPGRPVVILQRKRPPRQLSWTFEHLVMRAGHCAVPVYDWGEAGPTVADRFRIIDMPFREVIDHARRVSSPATQRYSITQVKVEQVPPLVGEYETPSFLASAERLDRLPAFFREPARRALFISFFRAMHWHNGREAVAQVAAGRKRFILFNPADSPYLYPRRLVDSGIAWFDEDEAVFCSELPFEQGMDAIDRRRWPLFENSTPLEVELQPGESLFIPSHWWHYTIATEPAVVIAHFWDAPIRRWGFPIAWRTFLMKPYRKYLYRRLLPTTRVLRQAFGCPRAVAAGS